jgi:acyl-CoA thioesterase-2
VPAAAAQLVDLLVLDQLDLDLFLGRQPDTDRQRVFGGQVAAQALMATIRTVDPAYVVHSLHSYFLLPGDTAVPIIYDVQRLRDGRSFGTRRVVARQHGRPIFYLTANFQRPEEGLEHQDVMPEVIPPEEAVDFLELMRSRGTDDAEALAKEWAALDVRFIGSSRRGLAEDPAHPARARLWMRVAGDLGEDAALHAAAFTYASDITLSSPGMQAASLDHALWFHRPFRADDWWLYDQVSPSASGGRGLSLAGVYAADGRRVATAAQEGLIRLRTTD